MENPIIADLEKLLKIAKKEKEKEPKSDQTRYWAVVHTELEKVLAYVLAYIS